MKKCVLFIAVFSGIYGYSQDLSQPYDYPIEDAYPGYDDSYVISEGSDTEAPQEQQTDSLNETDANKNGNDEKKESADKDKDKKEDEKKEEDEEEEGPKSPHLFTRNVTFVSDYRFRGISQTMRRPAIQGGFDYSNVCGFYLGTWASNVDGTTHFYNNTSMEWDWYAGYKFTPFPCYMPCFRYNVGLIYYYYPGGQALNLAHTRYHTAEFYLELTFDRLSIKYSQTITNYFGINADNTPFNWDQNLADPANRSSKGSNYLEANASLDIFEKVYYWWWCIEGQKLNLLLHAGHQTVRHYGHLSYADWKVTLTQEFDWFNPFITYVGTNAKHAYYDVPDNALPPARRNLGAHSVLFGVTKTF